MTGQSQSLYLEVRDAAFLLRAGAGASGLTPTLRKGIANAISLASMEVMHGVHLGSAPHAQVASDNTEMLTQILTHEALRTEADRITTICLLNSVLALCGKGDWAVEPYPAEDAQQDLN